MSWLDLHIHSNISTDGEFSPEQLMALCKQQGVRVAAIADHNSVRGVALASHYAQKHNIHLIPAIELDCRYNNIDLHLLGYGIEIDNPFFSQIDQEMAFQEQTNSSRQIELVQNMGIQINSETIWKMAVNGIVTPEMIAEVALQDKHNKDLPILAPYFPGGLRSDNPQVNFYWDLCAPGKAAYVPLKLIQLQEAVRIIHAAGGICILAHPVINIGMDEALIVEFITVGIDGIEVYSSYHHDEVINFYNNLTHKYQLLKTVGSDFHGKTKPAISLGSMSCNKDEEHIYTSLIHAISPG